MMRGGSGARLPLAQFHRDQASRRAAFPLFLPQMATQRAQTQTSTAAELASPHATVHKLRYHLPDFRSRPSPPHRYPFFSLHPSTSTQTSLLEQVR
jgi:hypothetical protein